MKKKLENDINERKNEIQSNLGSRVYDSMNLQKQKSRVGSQDFGSLVNLRDNSGIPVDLEEQ